MKDTQQEIDRLFEDAGHTVEGYTHIMKTLNKMMDNDKYDRSLIIDANHKAYRKCLRLRFGQTKIAWGGSL